MLLKEEKDFGKNKRLLRAKLIMPNLTLLLSPKSTLEITSLSIIRKKISLSEYIFLMLELQLPINRSILKLEKH